MAKKENPLSASSPAWVKINLGSLVQNAKVSPGVMKTRLNCRALKGF
jgi:hypothetical protein